MLETREPIEFSSDTLILGYRNCRAIVKKQLKPFLWPISNIAGENRRGVDAILAHLVSTLDLLDLESSDGLSLDVWNEIRDDLSDAFLDKYASPELAALVDTSRRFHVSKQYLFDPLRGADLWIRNRKFDNFEELETFCSYIGGATMASLVPVVGFVKEGFELTAIECGKAIMLTQLLANFVNDSKRNCIFLAKADLDSCKVDLSRTRLRQPTQNLRYLVRLYASRLEPIFEKAGQLMSYLDYDGRRSLESLLAMYWKMLARMQQDPDTVLSPDGVLGMTQMFGLKSRHVLGMTHGLSIIPNDDGHH